MNNCPKCGKELEEGAKFCDECGANVFEEIFCPNCGAKTSSEYRFCESCGASIVEEEEQTAVTPEPVPAPQTKVVKPIPKKLLLLGGAAVAVLAVLILVVSLIAGGASSKNYGMYLKDGELVLTDFSKDGAHELTSRLLEDSPYSFADYYDMAYLGYELGSFITFSEDNSKIFYPDRLDWDSEGVTLYYRQTKKPDAEPVKVDSDIERYSINAKGNRIVYLKGGDGNLYIHDLKEKEKIDNDVEFYYVNENLTKVAYQTGEGAFYLWYPGKDSVKMASDIESVVHVSEDLSTLYYIKDGSLYKQVEGADDKEKIASDVYDVEKVYESGAVYYTKVENTQINLMDYVDDDMAGVDAQITEPEYPDYPDSPDYPSWWDYDTDEAYSAAIDQYEADYEAYEEECDRLSEEYDQAYEAYWDKLSRDYLRENLRDAEVDHDDYSLYYYNGKESVMLTDALVNTWSLEFADDSPVAVVSIFNQSDVQKVKLSEIEYADEVLDLVEAARYSSSEDYIAVGDELSYVENTDAERFVLRDDGSAVFFLDDVSDSEHGDLYIVPINNGKVGSPEMYDSDVYKYSMYFLDNGKFVYYKNYSDETELGDLCVEGEEIDYDVLTYSAELVDNSIIYFTDWDDSKCYGTLKSYKNGTKTKIADDVSFWVPTPTNDLMYVYDYSLNYMTGTLYLYHKGDAQKLDDDVSVAIDLSNSFYKGD